MDTSTSWIVAAGCCWGNVFTFAIFRSAAIVYTELLHSLNTTREEASWPVTMIAIFVCVSGPIVGILARHFTIWKMTVSASLVSALTVSACFFANGIWFYILILGVLHGISISFIALSTTVLRQHFTRYRAIAVGLSYSGLTISGFIFPPLFQYLVDEYGTKGMFLVSGAVMSNATAGVLLHRLAPDASNKPKAVHKEDTGYISLTKKREVQSSFGKCASEKGAPVHRFIPGCPDKSALILNKSTTLNTCSDKINSDMSGIEECVDGANLVLTSSEICSSTTKIHQIKKDNGQEDECLQHTQAISCPDAKITNAVIHSTLTNCRSREFKNLFTEHAHVHEACHETHKYQACLKNKKNRIKICLPSYLKSLKFYLIASGCAVSNFIMSTYTTVFVDFATDRNISKWNAVLLLMLYSFGDLVARLGSGAITDKKFIRKNSMMALNFSVCAASLCLTPLCNSFHLQAILALLVGWCNGATIILTPVFYMELVEAERFSECFGISFLLSGIPLLPRPLLVGYFRDNLGDYQGLFVLMGVISALSAFTWILDRRISEVPPLTKALSDSPTEHRSVVREPGGRRSF